MYDDEPALAYYGPSISTVVETFLTLAFAAVVVLLTVLLVRVLLGASRFLAVATRDRELRLQLLLAERIPTPAPSGPAPAESPAPAGPAPAEGPAAADQEAEGPGDRGGGDEAPRAS